MLYIILTISILLNISLILFEIINKKKIKSLKACSLSTKENKIIKEILDSTTTNGDIQLKNSADIIINIIKKYYKLDYCSIFVYDDSKLTLVSSNADDKYYRYIELECRRIYEISNAKPQINSSDSILDYPSTLQRNIKYNYFIPLENIGAIFIENSTDKIQNEFEFEFFDLVIKNIRISLQNCIYHDRIFSIAMNDNLTQVYNRNYFYNFIKKSMNEDFCLCILDIDFFKKCNDTYGHNFGDIVLKTVANFIKDNIRSCDEIFRWGGEEFLIYIKDLDIQEAEKYIDQLRIKISQLIFTPEENILTNITASFGIAQSNDNDIDKLISLADSALYNSKSSGRNKVSCFF